MQIVTTVISLLSLACNIGLLLYIRKMDKEELATSTTSITYILERWCT